MEKNTKKEIKCVLVLGDSLTENGYLKKKLLFGFIPMGILAGLTKKSSPKDRFTNGRVWSDYFYSSLVAECFALYQANPRSQHKFSKQYSFYQKAFPDLLKKDDHHFVFAKRTIIRKYCEGGLTSHNYNSKNKTSFTMWTLLNFLANIPSIILQGVKKVILVILNFLKKIIDGKLNFLWNSAKGILSFIKQIGVHILNFLKTPAIVATRQIMSNLDEKLDLLLRHDLEHKRSAEEKASTLIIEWTGANDLVIVNSEPSNEAVDKAIKAKFKTFEQLIQNGYRNFCLFNMTDISKSPYFKVKSKEQQGQVQKAQIYFNNKMLSLATDLEAKYQEKGADIKIFDINEYFLQIYKNPEHYGFDSSKLTEFLKKSDELEIIPLAESKHKVPSKKFLFWDDVHPTTKAHSSIAQHFQEFFYKHYKFLPLEQPTNCAHSSCFKSDLPMSMSFG